MAHLFEIGDSVLAWDPIRRTTMVARVAAQHDDTRVVLEFDDDDDVVVIEEDRLRPAEDPDELEFMADSGTWR